METEAGMGARVRVGAGMGMGPRWEVPPRPGAAARRRRPLPPPGPGSSAQREHARASGAQREQRAELHSLYINFNRSHEASIRVTIDETNKIGIWRTIQIIFQTHHC